MRPAATVTTGALALLILIWGSTWSVIRIGLGGMPALTGVALRFALASLLLLGLAKRRGVALGRTATERRLWIANSILSFSVSYGVVYWAEQWVPSALAAVLFSTFPICVAMLAHWALPGERMTPRTLGGAGIGLAGVAWMFAADLSQFGDPMVVPASLVILLSPLSSAVGSVAVKRWGAGIHPLSLTAVPMGLCALTMGALAWLTERDQTIVWDGPTIGALFYLAVAGSAVTFTVYYWLLARLPATRLSFITYGVPAVALAIGVLWLDEPLTPGMVGGTILVLAGVALATWTGRAAGSPPTAADANAPGG